MVSSTCILVLATTAAGSSRSSVAGDIVASATVTGESGSALPAASRLRRRPSRPARPRPAHRTADRQHVRQQRRAAHIDEPASGVIRFITHGDIPPHKLWNSVDNSWRRICSIAMVGLCSAPDVRLLDNPAALRFVRFWTKADKRSVDGLSASAANDPKADIKLPGHPGAQSSVRRPDAVRRRNRDDQTHRAPPSRAAVVLHDHIIVGREGHAELRKMKLI